MTDEPRDADQTAACPHVILRDVLGRDMTGRLIDYVTAQRARFTPALVRNRDTQRLRFDPGVRDSMSLADLGPFRAPIERVVTGVAADVIATFGLAEKALVAADFEMTAFGDGGRFSAHVDTEPAASRIRILSCVYYFAVSPKAYCGGELRLFPFPTLARTTPLARAFIDIAPETDTLVLFPSWLTHEVRPVQVPSGAWRDSRFTINCWLRRAS